MVDTAAARVAASAAAAGGDYRRSSHRDDRPPRPYERELRPHQDLGTTWLSAGLLIGSPSSAIPLAWRGCCRTRD